MFFKDTKPSGHSCLAHKVCDTNRTKRSILNLHLIIAEIKALKLNQYDFESFCRRIVAESTIHKKSTDAINVVYVMKPVK